MTRRALITGITGQDGSYLAELLLQRGYHVFGLVRRSSGANTGRLQGVLDRVTLLNGDLLDASSLTAAVTAASPHEVYHLGAQSDVAVSFGQPVLTQDINGAGTVRLLEAIRHQAPEARVYQASSSEMFGMAATTPQDEETPFHPRSPYAASKVYAHHMAVHYREAHGLFVACGVAFNHESPRRGHHFVSRKVATAVAAIARGDQQELRLGNLDARRDWGWAPDYVDAMWRMLQADTPADLVLATGTDHAVRDLARVAFDAVGLCWTDHVVTDPVFERPTDVPLLRGDPSRAWDLLGWRPQVDFDTMITRMVLAEISAGRAPSSSSS